MSALDDLDVALLVWREAPAMLRRFHDGLRAALPDGWRGTVLLMENAPPDATRDAARAELAAYPRARVLHSPRNLGYARAMDLALAELDGAYVALLNSDGRPRPGMLETLVGALEADPEALWAAPAVHGPGERNEPPGPPFAEEEQAGMALVVRRRDLLALGAFDPAYWFYGEDHDASARARAAGRRLLRVPDAVFDHGKGGRSARGRFVREGLHALANQTLVLHRTPDRPAAWRRVAHTRVRSLREHAGGGDWPAVAAIALATVALPVSVALAESRRRRPWSGPRFERWLARRRPRVTEVRPAPQGRTRTRTVGEVPRT